MDSKDNNTPELSDVSMSLNGFEIKLSRNQDTLMIEAEEIGPDSRFFTTHINNNEIKGLTNSLFQDSLSLQQGLLDGHTVADSSIQVKFSDEGKICYTWETQHGSRRICFEFVIPLTEVKLDPLKALERKVEKLQRKVEEQENEISQLKNEKEKSMSSSEKVILDKIEAFEKKSFPKLLEENNQFGKKLETNLQEKIERLERFMKDMQSSIERRYNLFEIENRLDQKLKEVSQLPLPFPFNFDTAAKNASSFSFSNNNRTVAYNGNSWNFIYTEKPLPKTSKSFSIKLDHSQASNDIMVGIVPACHLKSTSCYSSAGTYLYYACSGTFYCNGKLDGSSISKSTTNSIITVTTDLSANKIQWTLDNNQTWSTTLDSSYTRDNEYYPCVELYRQNDKVSFV